MSLTSKNAKKATKRKEMIKKENQDPLRMMDSRPKENKDNPRIIHSKKLRRMISKWSAQRTETQFVEKIR